MFGLGFTKLIFTEFKPFFSYVRLLSFFSQLMSVETKILPTFAFPFETPLGKTSCLTKKGSPKGMFFYTYALFASADVKPP